MARFIQPIEDAELKLCERCGVYYAPLRMIDPDGDEIEFEHECEDLE